MPTLTFKVTAEEARRIRALALQNKLSVSEYLRRQAQPGRESQREIQLVTCPRTGATIFGPSPDLPALTTESVRALLDEFP